MVANLCLLLLLFQFPDNRPDRVDPDRFPDGRKRSEEILKAEHKKTLEDLAEVKKLIAEITEEFERNDRHVLSVGTLKKLDEIDKRTRRIRGRLKRY